jgi:hypothetical protein
MRVDRERANASAYYRAVIASLVHLVLSARLGRSVDVLWNATLISIFR